MEEKTINELEQCKYHGDKEYLEHANHDLRDLEEIVHILREHCLSDGRMWEVLTARYFSAICLPDCTVMHVTA